MQWLNEPASWQRAGDVIKVDVDRGTDFWCETGYGYVRDSGHVYGRFLPGDLDVSVRVRPSFTTQYEQAGIMLRVDERTWLKTGLEFFEGRHRLSTVLTLGRSSWMMADLPQDTEEITLRASRRGDAVEVRYTADGTASELAALVYLPPGRDVLAGVMCAAPEGTGFTVTFRDLRIAGREWAGEPGGEPGAEWAGEPEAGAAWEGGEGPDWDGEPELAEWAGEAEPAEWAGEADPAQWAGEPEAGAAWEGGEGPDWDGEPEPAEWAGEADPAQWAGEPEPAAGPDEKASAGWAPPGSRAGAGWAGVTAALPGDDPPSGGDADSGEWPGPPRAASDQGGQDGEARPESGLSGVSEPDPETTTAEDPPPAAAGQDKAKQPAPGPREPLDAADEWISLLTGDRADE